MPQAVAAAWSAAQFIGSVFAGTAFGAGTLASGLAQATATAALTAGINAAVANNSQPRDQGGFINLELNPSAPRRLVLGKRALGGTLANWFVSGSDNTRLYLPIYLSEGPCGTITRVFAGGRVVHNTPLVHGVKTVIPTFRSGGDRLWLTYYDGRVGQTADPTLVGLGQGWTAANKMTGMSYVVAEMWWDSDNMRQPAQLVFEHEGAKLYDRRKDTTAGGSGSHRLDDPSTWELSSGAEGANPAVALDHYQLGRYWNGHRVFGIGMDVDDVPFDRFAAQANICDEGVVKKAGGTQMRYRANGIIFASEPYDDTIKRLCTAMAAEPADFGGRVGVVGVEARTPVMSIDDDDIIDMATETYSPKRSWGELVGAVEGKFQDPAQLYQPTPYPEVTDAAWDVQDGGEPKRITHNLEFEIDAERAQRLALLKAKYERRQGTLRGVYPFWTIELERGDWFVRTGRAGSRFGEAGKAFEVMERILDPKTGLVTIIAKEVDPEDSAWDESVALDGPPAPADGTDAISEVLPPLITVTDNPIVGEGSTTPALKVAFGNPLDPRVQHLFVEVTRASDGLKVAVENAIIPDADEELVVQNGIAELEAYAVRARFLTSGLYSDWSDIAFVTTGAAYNVPTASAPFPGSLLDLALSDVAAELDEASKKLDKIVGSDWPEFWIVGGHGDIDIEANVDAPSDIKVSAGYIDHWTLGKQEIEETHFGTAWGELYAPPNGLIGIAWSQQPVAERFSNGAGHGHIFPYARELDGSLKAYGLDLHGGETFEPAITDMVLATAEKPLADGSDVLSSADGITRVENLIRDTKVVNARLNALEAVSGEGSAAIEEVALALADEIEARALQGTTLTANLAAANASIALVDLAVATETAVRAGQTATLTTNLGLANSSIAANSTAITTEAATRASQTALLTSNYGSLSATVLVNTSAIATLDGRLSAYWGIKVAAGTNIATIEALAVSGGVPSTVLINAGQILMNGAVLVNGSVSASKIAVTDLSAISAVIGLLRTATTGERMELRSNKLSLFSASNIECVELGVL